MEGLAEQRFEAIQVVVGFGRLGVGVAEDLLGWDLRVPLGHVDCERGRVLASGHEDDVADRWLSERFQCFLHVSDWHYPPTLLGKLVHCPNDDGTGFLGADGVGDRAQRRLQPGIRYVDERLDLGLELLEQPVPK